MPQCPVIMDMLIEAAAVGDANANGTAVGDTSAAELAEMRSQPIRSVLDVHAHQCHLASVIKQLWMDMPSRVAMGPVPKLLLAILLLCYYY